MVPLRLLPGLLSISLKVYLKLTFTVTTKVFRGLRGRASSERWSGMLRKNSSGPQRGA